MVGDEVTLIVPGQNDDTTMITFPTSIFVDYPHAHATALGLSFAILAVTFVVLLSSCVLCRREHACAVLVLLTATTAAAVLPFVYLHVNGIYWASMAANGRQFSLPDTNGNGVDNDSIGFGPTLGIKVKANSAWLTMLVVTPVFGGIACGFCLLAVFFTCRDRRWPFLA